MKYIYCIVDLKTKKLLYGKNGFSLKFSTQEIAEEVAKQFFEDKSEYLVIEIKVME